MDRRTGIKIAFYSSIVVLVIGIAYMFYLIFTSSGNPIEIPLFLYIMLGASIAVASVAEFLNNQQRFQDALAGR